MLISLTLNFLLRNLDTVPKISLKLKSDEVKSSLTMAMPTAWLVVAVFSISTAHVATKGGFGRGSGTENLPNFVFFLADVGLSLCLRNMIILSAARDSRRPLLTPRATGHGMG